MLKKTKTECLKEIKTLGEFWEKHFIECKDGILEIGNGRNKSDLYKTLLSKHYNKETFENKTILDIGCNAGGNLVELSKFNPKFLTGIDYSDFYLKQCDYILRNKNIQNYSIFKYKFMDGFSYKKYENDLKKFDVIFCLGVIYHCRKKTVEDILKYLYNCGKKVIMSSQTFNSNLRKNIDWDISRKTIEQMVLNAGFSSIKVLTYKTDTNYKNLQGLTNDFYFECVF